MARTGTTSQLLTEMLDWKANPLSGDDIRMIRGSLNMTQTELALALGTTQNTVSRWEGGTTPVANPVMLRLALEGLLARMSHDCAARAADDA